MVRQLEPYWSVPESQVLQSLETTPSGLSSSEVLHRQKKYSRQSLAGRRRSSFSIFAAQFNSPIILLLFASAVLSYLLEDQINAFIIGLILVLSGFLGFWQERAATDAVAKLQATIQTKVTALRDGVERGVATESIVPGDVLLFRAGSVVPGDCRVLESRQLYVDESVLTGESFPIEKQTAILSMETPLAKRNNCLYTGTHVVSGMSKAVVVAVGMTSELGKISSRLESRPPITGFEVGLRNFGKLLLILTIVLVTTVWLVNIAFQRYWMESLLFALALAVGMTPQLLPAITSVVLANGARSMASSQVIVKRLLAIENFGGMTILCLDKTGTLTEGRVALDSVLGPTGLKSPLALELAAINAHMQNSFENPIDAAIRSIQPAVAAGIAKIDELPYDFRRKRLSVLIEKNGTRTLIVKGAMENTLALCSHARVSGSGPVPIGACVDQIRSQFLRWSNDGFRVLAVAYRDGPHRQIPDHELTEADEVGLVFAGFLIFSDPLKPQIHTTIQSLKNLGIGLKLITGDNRVVASSVARRAGLSDLNGLTGPEIRKLSLDELSAAVVRTDVFAEIEPDQKEQIVLALKSSKHIVGFLGDGINDAPALHSADVGISVEGAVDVAKEAAQIVLLQPDLNVLVKGVHEGRKTLANTLKYVFVSISANFGYMLSMAIASLFLPFLPLLPTQILLINLLADMPAMALAADNVDPEAIERPRQWEITTIVRFMLLFGLTGTFSDLMTFGMLIWILQVSQEQFRTVWFVISIFTGIVIMLAVRTRRSFFSSQPGGWLILAACVVIAITLILPYSAIGPVFELERPTVSQLGVVALVTLLYAVAIESGKRVFYRNQSMRPGTSNNRDS